MSQSEKSEQVAQFEIPDTILSRRAIFNSQENVIAYELKLDHSLEKPANEREEAITAELLLRLVDAGLSTFVDGLTAFIPVSRSYVRAGLPVIEHTENLVFEIPEGLLEESEKRRFFSSVKRGDIHFAWVHPKPGSLDGELLDRVEYVKLDVTSNSQAQLNSLIKFYKSHGIKLIADQVSTPIMFEQCKSMGFDYFMGYFFCMPRVIESKQIPASKISVLQLICELQNPNTTLDRVQEIVEKDVSLSYRVLRYINSPVFQLSKKIDSIKQAILIAGVNTIKTISVIVAHSRIDDKPPELFKVALLRARIGETLAFQYKLPTDALFLLGLFSTLDALTDTEMPIIAAKLPLTDEIRHILVTYYKSNEPSNAISHLLKSIVSFEIGDWEVFDECGFDNFVMREHYWKAVNWVGMVLSMLSGPQITKI